jgi:hypothetical protein
MPGSVFPALKPPINGREAVGPEFRHAGAVGGLRLSLRS